MRSPRADAAAPQLSARRDGVPPCPACETREAMRVVDVLDHEYAMPYVAHYVHCGACATVYQHPMPNETDLSGFYPASYHSMTDGGRLMDARRAMRVKRLRAQLR